MTNMSDVYGKTFGPENNDQDSSYMNQDIFDPGSHVAKLKKARAVPISIIQNGNGENNNQESKKKVHYTQKYSEDDLIAEAVVIAGVPYFAVGRKNPEKITLEKSLSVSDTSEYRPFELAAYLTKPYIFNSKLDFESCVNRAKNENLYPTYFLEYR
jgi:hypothetical protein